eukprot:Pgem_evm1s14002
MSSSFEVLKKWQLQIISTLLFALTLGMLLTGLLTTSWLTNSIDVYIPRYQTVVLNVTTLEFN